MTNWDAAERRRCRARGSDGGFLESLRRGFRALPGTGAERLSPRHRMEPRAAGEEQPNEDSIGRAIGTPPPFDHAALDHYAGMFAACLRNGLEPVVTLHHFVHPAWLGTDPWLDETDAGAFRGIRAHGRRHVNERLAAARSAGSSPSTSRTCSCSIRISAGSFPAQAPRPVFEPMIARVQQLLRAHVLAYNALHDLYAERGWPAPAVSLQQLLQRYLLVGQIAARSASACASAACARDSVGEHICERAREFDGAFRAARISAAQGPRLLFRRGRSSGRATGSATAVSTPANFAPLLDTLYASAAHAAPRLHRPRLLRSLCRARLSPAGVVGPRIQEPIVPLVDAGHGHEQMVGLARAAARAAFFLQISTRRISAARCSSRKTAWRCAAARTTRGTRGGTA